MARNFTTQVSGKAGSVTITADWAGRKALVIVKLGDVTLFVGRDQAATLVGDLQHGMQHPSLFATTDGDGQQFVFIADAASDASQVWATASGDDIRVALRVGRQDLVTALQGAIAHLSASAR